MNKDPTLVELLREVEARAIDYGAYGGEINSTLINWAETQLLYYLEQNYTKKET